MHSCWWFLVNHFEFLTIKMEAAAREEDVPIATTVISRPKRQRMCLRLCHRYRYDDPDIENLYDRYVFHLQHTSIQCLLVLLITLTISIAVLNFIFVSHASVENVSNFSLCIIFVILLIFIHTRFMTVAQLPLTGYLIAFLCLCLAVVSMPVNFMEQADWIFTAADGVWRMCYIMIAVYAFLPLRIAVAVLIGLLLPVAHTCVSVFFATSYQWLLWRQVGQPVISLPVITTNFTVIYKHAILSLSWFFCHINTYMSVCVVCYLHLILGKHGESTPEIYTQHLFFAASHILGIIFRVFVADRFLPASDVAGRLSFTLVITNICYWHAIHREHNLPAGEMIRNLVMVELHMNSPEKRSGYCALAYDSFKGNRNTISSTDL